MSCEHEKPAKWDWEEGLMENGYCVNGAISKHLVVGMRLDLGGKSGCREEARTSQYPLALL